jgi:hypothetical protein
MKIAIPKYQGGWGLKNIFMLSKARAEKNNWRLLQGARLWVHIIKDKYLAPNTIED